MNVERPKRITAMAPVEESEPGENMSGDDRETGIAAIEGDSNIGRAGPAGECRDDDGEKSQSCVTTDRQELGPATESQSSETTVDRPTPQEELDRGVDEGLEQGVNIRENPLYDIGRIIFGCIIVFLVHFDK